MTGWCLLQTIVQRPELEAGRSHSIDIERPSNQYITDIFALLSEPGLDGSSWLVPYDEYAWYSFFYCSHPSMQSVYEYMHSTGYGTDEKKDV